MVPKMLLEGQGWFFPATPDLDLLRGKQMKNVLFRLWKEEEGQDLTEYALLLVLLSLAAITTLGTLASAINSVFNKAATNLST
jgi:pilus assembly protein Flp/PilA